MLNELTHILIQKSLLESRAVAYDVQGEAYTILNDIEQRLEQNKKTKIQPQLFKYEGIFQRLIFNQEYTILFVCYDAHNTDVPQIPIGASLDLTNKQLTVTLLRINNKIEESRLLDSISHEVEHIYQIQHRSKNITDFKTSHNLYKKAIELINNKENKGRTSMLSRIIYLSYWGEQDAYVNGLYAFLSKNVQTIDTLKFFLEQSDAYKHLKFLIKCTTIFEIENLESDDWQLSFKRFKKTPKWFKTLLGRTIKRFRKKIGYVVSQFEKDKFNIEILH